MKAFIVVFLAVAALAEPEAQFDIYGRPIVAASPMAYALTHPAVQYVQPAVQYIKPQEDKVQMEQEQEAIKVESYSNEQEQKTVEIPVAAGTPMVYAAHQPLTYTYQPAVTYVNQAVPAKYVAQSAGASHTVYKREAESFYPYTAAVTPYAYPTVYAAGQYYANQYAAVPATVYNQQYVAPVFGQAKTYANDFVKPQNYASKGQYVAQSAGAIHVAKREAESFYPYTSAAVSYPYANVYANQYPLVNTYSNLYNYNGVYRSPYVYGF